EIAEKVRSGATAGWLRAEKEYSRTIETLFEADQAARTSPIGAAYAQAADESGATLESLFVQARGVVQSAASCVGGAMADDAAFADQMKSFRDRLTAFDHHL